MAIQGYDTWVLGYPPEYDGFDVCSACDHEVEFEDAGLCGDCYYERNHGNVISMLDDAVRHLQKHFDTGTANDIKHANSLVSLAMGHIQEIGGLCDA